MIYIYVGESPNTACRQAGMLVHRGGGAALGASER